MSELNDVSQDLVKQSEAVQVLAMEAEAARHDYEVAKQAYDLIFQGAIMAAKAEDPKRTQTDLKAHATDVARHGHAQMLAKKSVYRRLQVDLEAGVRRFEALTEKSYNLRLEAKLLRGA